MVSFFKTVILLAMAGFILLVVLGISTESSSSSTPQVKRDTVYIPTPPTPSSSLPSSSSAPVVDTIVDTIKITQEQPEGERVKAVTPSVQRELQTLTTRIATEQNQLRKLAYERDRLQHTLTRLRSSLQAPISDDLAPRERRRLRREKKHLQKEYDDLVKQLTDLSQQIRNQAELVSTEIEHLEKLK